MSRSAVPVEHICYRRADYLLFSLTPLTSHCPLLSAQLYDTRAVETTAYGLLAYLIRDGVNIDQEKMVLWLNTMRMNDGGFISTTVRILTRYGASSWLVFSVQQQLVT